MLSHTEKQNRLDTIVKYLYEGYHPKDAVRQAAGVLGMAYSALKVWADRETNKQSDYAPDWSIYTSPDQVEENEIAYATVKTTSYPGKRVFLCMGAQDETPVHEGFWENLLAYAKHRDAQIIIGGFTYQKGLFQDHAVATGYFVPEVREYLNPNIVELGNHMVFNGNANILPTNASPTNGWETASGRKSMIVPHAKISMRSIPRFFGQRRKQIFSSGVCTVPNYTSRNAGQKAVFHHTIGCTVVEIDVFGDHFVRQIHADLDGSFYDLHRFVKDGVVETGHTVEGITWGDVHRYVLNRDVALGSWGFDTDTDMIVNSYNMLDVLKPKHQFIHDSYDFYSRSSHDRNSAFERHKRYMQPIDNVQWEMAQTTSFLGAVRRNWCDTVHIASNHNYHLDRWVLDDSIIHDKDTENDIYWLETRAMHLRAARSKVKDWMLHEAVLRNEAKDRLEGIKFHKAGRPFVICGNVECGQHGHRGSNGAKGTVAGFKILVDKMNIADKHSPAIMEGVYCAGTSSDLWLDYNQESPSGWDHTHTITYKNGKRTLVSMIGERWHVD